MWCSDVLQILKYDSKQHMYLCYNRITYNETFIYNNILLCLIILVIVLKESDNPVSLYWF